MRVDEAINACKVLQFCWDFGWRASYLLIFIESIAKENYFISPEKMFNIIKVRNNREFY